MSRNEFDTVPRTTTAVTPYVFVIVPLLAIVFPKSLAVLVPVLGLLAVADLVATGRVGELKRIPSAFLFVIAFFIWATASALWGNDPGQAFMRGSVGLLTVVAAYICIQWCRANQDVVQRSAPWFVVGFVVALLFILFELLSNQLLSKFVVTGFSGKEIRRFILNLNVTAAALLLWPTLVLAGYNVEARKAKLIKATLFALSLLAVFLSENEASKLALLVSLLAFVLASFWPTLTRVSLLFGWSAATLLIVPVCLFAHQQLKLDQASWINDPLLLQSSAKHRIVIWGNLSERVFEAPIIGHGTRSIYKINLDDKNNGRGINTLGLNAIPPHAHNLYVQTWFELGAVGALLLFGIGVLLMNGLRSVTHNLYPIGAAAAATGMIEVLPGFELWQQWFLAALTLSCITTVAALAVVKSPNPASHAAIEN